MLQVLGFFGGLVEVSVLGYGAMSLGDLCQDMVPCHWVICAKCSETT